jgi:YihY family inner membrane protein
VHLHTGGRGTLNLWRRAFRRIDEWQRRRTATAVPVAVFKKYGDDRGGSLAALVTFYGFLAVFPLLLLFVTVAGIVLGGNKEAEKRIVDSALSEFPVIGDKLASSITALHRATPLAFVVSAIGLLWGSLGVTNHLQQASARIWDVPRRREAGLLPRVARGLFLLGTIGAAVVGSAVLAGISTIGGGRVHSSPAAYWAYTLVGAAAVNLAAYLVALHILAPEGTSWRCLLPGTVIGGIGWTALETVGGLLVSRYLRHSTQLYGLFATVLGLVFWLSLGSQLFMYASETNVVLLRRLWPRHLDDPPPQTLRLPAEAGGVVPPSADQASAAASAENSS